MSEYLDKPLRTYEQALTDAILRAWRYRDHDRANKYLRLLSKVNRPAAWAHKMAMKEIA